MSESTLETKVDQFVQLRNAKKRMKAEFDNSVKRITEAMNKLEAEILDAFNTQGMTSVKTLSGTAYRNVQSSASVKDRDEFVRWASKTGNTEAIDIRANKKIIRELSEEGTVVPGVNYSERVTIGVRSN